MARRRPDPHQPLLFPAAPHPTGGTADAIAGPVPQGVAPADAVGPAVTPGGSAEGGDALAPVDHSADEPPGQDGREPPPAGDPTDGSFGDVPSPRPDGTPPRPRSFADRVRVGPRPSGVIAPEISAPSPAAASGGLKAHQLTYAGGLVRCGHCGNLITGEQIVKPATGKHYVYYRCTVSRLGDHPRTRVTERELDVQVLSVFRSIRQPDEIAQWFATALRRWSTVQRAGSQEHAQLLQRELGQLRQQQDKLLNLRLADEIDADAFAAKTELRDRIAILSLQVEVVDRDRGEQGELAVKVFELSQALERQWLTAGFAEKRKLLELVFSNFRLNGVSLDHEINKPFDVLVKGLAVPSNRGDKI